MERVMVTSNVRTVGLSITLLAIFLSPSSAFPRDGNCTQKDNSSRPDCPRAIAFFGRVQSALKRDDRRSLASMVNYPLRANLKGHRVYILNRDELLSHFDELFDDGVRSAVLKATREDVWGNWQGFMIGHGAIWFDAIIPHGEEPDPKAADYWAKYLFKIITINNGDGARQDQ